MKKYIELNKKIYNIIIIKSNIVYNFFDLAILF